MTSCISSEWKLAACGAGCLGALTFFSYSLGCQDLGAIDQGFNSSIILIVFLVWFGS